MYNEKKEDTTLQISNQESYNVSSTSAQEVEDKKRYYDINLAKKYSVEEAVILNHFVYWIKKNVARGINFHDEHTWTFHTIKDFTDYFEEFSIQNIRTILNKLVKNRKVLITGNYNKRHNDRTLWYALSDEKSFGIEYPAVKSQPLKKKESTHLLELTNQNTKVENKVQKSFVRTNISICENQQIHLLELTNPFVNSNTALPYNTPNDKPNNKKYNNILSYDVVSLLAEKENKNYIDMNSIENLQNNLVGEMVSYVYSRKKDQCQNKQEPFFVALGNCCADLVKEYSEYASIPDLKENFVKKDSKSAFYKRFINETKEIFFALKD